MKNLVILILALLMFGCQARHRKHKQVVKCYKQHVVNTQTNMDEILFWYIIMNSDNTCYYTASSTPVTNYAATNWTLSQTNPISQLPQAEVEEQPQVEVENTELSPEMQTEMEANVESVETDAASDAASDAGNDAGSGDAGGDAGGGDGGE